MKLGRMRFEQGTLFPVQSAFGLASRYGAQLRRRNSSLDVFAGLLMELQVLCRHIAQNHTAFFLLIENFQESEVCYRLEQTNFAPNSNISYQILSLQGAFPSASAKVQCTLKRIVNPSYTPSAWHPSGQDSVSIPQEDQNQARTTNRSQRNPPNRNLVNLYSTETDNSSCNTPSTRGSANLTRKKRKQDQIADRLEQIHNIKEPEILAAGLLEERLGWTEGSALACEIDVHHAEDLKDIGYEILDLQRAVSILFAYHCLFVYEVVLKLSGRVKLDSQGLHTIVKQLNLKPDLKILVAWATVGHRYKQWVDLNDYRAILFVGGRIWYESRHHKSFSD
jgi:hypothetical protein